MESLSGNLGIRHACEGNDSAQPEPSARPAHLPEQILCRDRERFGISRLKAWRRSALAVNGIVFSPAVGGDGTESVFNARHEVAREGLQRSFDPGKIAQSCCLNRPELQTLAAG